MSAESPEIRIETTEESPVARRLEVIVAPARVRQAFDRAYRELARGVRVRGFRLARDYRKVHCWRPLRGLFRAVLASPLANEMWRDAATSSYVVRAETAPAN